MEGLLIAIGSVVVIIRWVYLRDRMNAIERRLYVLECSYTASPAVAWHPPAAPPPPRPASPPARAPEPAAAAPPPPPEPRVAPVSETFVPAPAPPTPAPAPARGNGLPRSA